jgi:hypothetical protein
MPLKHVPWCQGGTKLRYPIPGKFDPETGTHGAPSWHTKCQRSGQAPPDIPEGSFVFRDDDGTVIALSDDDVHAIVAEYRRRRREER